MDTTNKHYSTLGFVQNITLREQLLTLASNDKAFQEFLRQECSKDVMFFISLFVWQYNPLRKGGREVGPFVPWKFQRRAVLKVPGVHWSGEEIERIDDAGILWCIQKDRSLLIEKSRDMGASWLCLLVFLWLFLFRPYQKFLCISRNELAVEDADPDSLFWKLDFVLEHLPAWLLPRKGINRVKRFFGNNDNGSSITGQASTGLAGVGGRATAMLIDEFSMIKEDKEVRQRARPRPPVAAFSTAPTRASTPSFTPFPSSRRS